MEKIYLTIKRKEIIETMGFLNILEILRYYPYRYEIYQDEILNMSKHLKKVSFVGKIASNVKVDYITKGRTKTSFIIQNNKQSVKAIMFNRFVNKKFLYEGANIIVSGKYNAFNNEISVSSFYMEELKETEKIVPIYSLPTSIKDSTYRQFVNYIYQQGDNLNLYVDTLPLDLIKKYHLVSFKEAIQGIHFPKDKEQLRQSFRYLKYEEFLNFCLIGALKRQINDQHFGEKIKKIDISFVKEFIYQLPFQLTTSQKNVLKEIIDDLNSKHCMTRLLQGDVGSGKTIVALISLIANYTCHLQGALMAPTDILARQHYESIQKFLKNYSQIKVALLVSEMPIVEKKEVLRKLENNEIDIIIGTHSLIQEKVVFASLGLIIIDEQHRFGVKQRVALKEKGQQIDVLYMSATPIPRTLASTIYMDMDVSTIQGYPYKNRIVYTKFVKENSINSIKKEIDCYLKSNQKIYVVCPSIEDSTLDLKTVKEIKEELKTQFSNYKVEILHGKIKNDEKNKIMNQFINNEIQILVSTTVIEVGINVFDANMMIIYNAERFGLAQIHQLRGRIARDGKIGYCYLLSQSIDEDAIERLNFIASTNDGFEISKYDLKRRGAGDMLGLAQSGKSPFRLANLIDDFNILLAASKDANEIIKNPNNYKKLIEQSLSTIKNTDQYLD